MASRYPLNFQAKKKIERLLPAPTVPFIREAKAFPEVLSKYLHIFHWPRLGHLATTGSKRIWESGIWKRTTELA